MKLYPCPCSLKMIIRLQKTFYWFVDTCYISVQYFFLFLLFHWLHSPLFCLSSSTTRSGWSSESVPVTNHLRNDLLFYDMSCFSSYVIKLLYMSVNVTIEMLISIYKQQSYQHYCSTLVLKWEIGSYQHLCSTLGSLGALVFRCCWSCLCWSQ